MKDLVPLMVLVALPFFSSPTSAVQAGSGPFPPALGVPAGAATGGNQCFQDYFNHVKQCRDEFCPNRFVNCQETALRACIDGAKDVLRDCLEG